MGNISLNVLDVTPDVVDNTFEVFIDAAGLPGGVATAFFNAVDAKKYYIKDNRTGIYGGPAGFIITAPLERGEAVHTYLQELVNKVNPVTGLHTAVMAAGYTGIDYATPGAAGGLHLANPKNINIIGRERPLERRIEEVLTDPTFVTKFTADQVSETNLAANLLDDVMNELNIIPVDPPHIIEFIKRSEQIQEKHFKTHASIVAPLLDRLIRIAYIRILTPRIHTIYTEPTIMGPPLNVRNLTQAQLDSIFVDLNADTLEKRRYISRIMKKEILLDPGLTNDERDFISFLISPDGGSTIETGVIIETNLVNNLNFLANTPNLNSPTVVPQLKILARILGFNNIIDPDFRNIVGNLRILALIQGRHKVASNSLVDAIFNLAAPYGVLTPAQIRTKINELVRERINGIVEDRTASNNTVSGEVGVFLKWLYHTPVPAPPPPTDLFLEAFFDYNLTEANGNFTNVMYLIEQDPVNFYFPRYDFMPGYDDLFRYRLAFIREKIPGGAVPPAPLTAVPGFPAQGQNKVLKNIPVVPVLNNPNEKLKITIDNEGHVPEMVRYYTVNLLNFNKHFYRIGKAFTVFINILQSLGVYNELIDLLNSTEMQNNDLLETLRSVVYHLNNPRLQRAFDEIIDAFRNNLLPVAPAGGPVGPGEIPDAQADEVAKQVAMNFIVDALPVATLPRYINNVMLNEHVGRGIEARKETRDILRRLVAEGQDGQLMLENLTIEERRYLSEEYEVTVAQIKVMDKLRALAYATPPVPIDATHQRKIREEYLRDLEDLINAGTDIEVEKLLKDLYAKVLDPTTLNGLSTDFNKEYYRSRENARTLNVIVIRVEDVHRIPMSAEMARGRRNLEQILNDTENIAEEYEEKVVKGRIDYRSARDYVEGTEGFESAVNSLRELYGAIPDGISAQVRANWGFFSGANTFRKALSKFPGNSGLGKFILSVYQQHPQEAAAYMLIAEEVFPELTETQHRQMYTYLNAGNNFDAATNKVGAPPQFPAPLFDLAVIVLQDNDVYAAKVRGLMYEEADYDEIQDVRLQEQNGIVERNKKLGIKRYIWNPVFAGAVLGIGVTAGGGIAGAGLLVGGGVLAGVTAGKAIRNVIVDIKRRGTIKDLEAGKIEIADTVKDRRRQLRGMGNTARNHAEAILATYRLTNEELDRALNYLKVIEDRYQYLNGNKIGTVRFNIPKPIFRNKTELAKNSYSTYYSQITELVGRLRKLYDDLNNNLGNPQVIIRQISELDRTLNRAIIQFSSKVGSLAAAPAVAGGNKPRNYNISKEMADISAELAEKPISSRTP